jgi:hypothetical protein
MHAEMLWPNLNEPRLFNIIQDGYACTHLWDLVFRFEQKHITFFCHDPIDFSHHDLFLQIVLGYSVLVMLAHSDQIVLVRISTETWFGRTLCSRIKECYQHICSINKEGTYHDYICSNRGMVINSSYIELHCIRWTYVYKNVL